MPGEDEQQIELHGRQFELAPIVAQQLAAPKIERGDAEADMIGVAG